VSGLWGSVGWLLGLLVVVGMVGYGGSVVWLLGSFFFFSYC
jgi:hypothetical protein